MADKESDRRNSSPRFRRMHADLAGTTPVGPSAISGNIESSLFGLPRSYRRRTRHFTTWIALAATYTMAGKIGLAVVGDVSASAVWAPSGIARGSADFRPACVAWYRPRRFSDERHDRGVGDHLDLHCNRQYARSRSRCVSGGSIRRRYPFLTRGRDIPCLRCGRGAQCRVSRDSRRDHPFVVRLRVVVGIPLRLADVVAWRCGGSCRIRAGDSPVGSRPRPNWSRAERTEFLVLLFVAVTVGWIVFVGSHNPLTFLWVPVCVCRFQVRSA